MPIYKVTTWKAVSETFKVVADNIGAIQNTWIDGRYDGFDRETIEYDARIVLIEELRD